MTKGLRCSKCKKSLAYQGAGRPPKYHPECHPDPARLLKRAKANEKKLRGELTEATRIRDVATIPVPTSDGWRSRLLAIGLGLDPDASRAASLVGISERGDALAPLVEDARRHRELTERRPGAIGAYLATAIGLGAVRLAAAMGSGEISVDRTPAALRALVQALEGIQGSTQPSYSEIRLVIRAPDGTQIDAATGQVVTELAS